MYILQEKLFDIPTINLVQKEVYGILSSIVDKNGNINKKTVERYASIHHLDEKILKTVHSSKLKKLSNDLFIANKEKPIKINITLSCKGNSYTPTKNELKIVIPLQSLYSLNIFLENGCSNIFEVNRYSFRNSRAWKRGITQFKDFVNEYDNSIAHELSHWVDDALHNSFFIKLKVFADQTNLTEKEFEDIYRSNPVDTMFFEINAQIHVIANLKSRSKDWETLTLSDIIMSHSGLRAVLLILYESGPDLIYKWTKALVKRMRREGLLTNNIEPLDRNSSLNMIKFLMIREGVLLE